MMSEEDKISLIMEGNNSSSPKLWLLWKQRSQKPSNSYSYLGIKIIQDEFRHMLCGNCMMLNVALVFYTCNFENCKHAFQVTNKKFPSIRVSQNHDVSIIQCLSILVNILQLHISSWVEGNVVKDHHNFLQEVINFDWRLQLSCNENFDRGIMLQNVVELVKHCLIILFNKFLTSFLLVFNSNRFLAHFLGKFLPFFSFFHLDLILHHVSFVVNLNSLLLIFDLVWLFFESSGELLHTLWALLDRLSLRFGSNLLFVRFIFDFLSHC